MNAKQVINLDYRDPKNQEIIQKGLCEIKPLSKFLGKEEVPMWAIEKAITVMCKKYNMRISGITSDVYGSDTNIIWRADIVTEHNYKTVGTVFGISMYELFAKAAIVFHEEVKKGAKLRSK